MQTRGALSNATAFASLAPPCLGPQATGASKGGVSSFFLLPLPGLPLASSHPWLLPPSLVLTPRAGPLTSAPPQPLGLNRSNNEHITFNPSIFMNK